MNFNIEYSKIVNKFFFISNLAEWHFSCRKEYNDIWLKQTNALNDNEKNALKSFGEIVKKYGFTDKYLGKIFLVQHGRCPKSFYDH